MTGALGRDFVGQVIAYLICAPGSLFRPFSVSFFLRIEYIERHFLLIMRRCLSARESAAKKVSTGSGSVIGLAFAGDPIICISH